jgi:two-component system, OmpR family, sensor histidine kinase QseC
MTYFSIRKRLLLGIFLSMIMILGGMGLVAHLVTEHESEEIFSARLATSARVLEVLTARQLEHATITNPIIIELPDELEHQHSSTEEINGHPYESKISFQIWHNNGKLLAKSATAPDKPLGPMTEGFGKNLIGDDVWQVFQLKSGDVWVMVAEMDAVREEMSGDLGVAIMTPLIIGSLLLLIVINLIAYRSLRPLQALANVIASREPQSIKPITLSKTPSELKPVIDELNHLLDRVQKAFKREQQFIDAAAHEIRTPIAALQLHIENAVNAKNDVDRDQSLAEALSGLRRTTRLTEQLLTLSRVSGATDQEKQQILSLDGICKEVVKNTKPLISQRGQTIELNVSDDCLIQGEQHKIERVIQNLIDNASQYGSVHGLISVSLAKVSGTIRLVVSNDGDIIPESEKTKVFDPYYRILGSKSFGSGLGLAIVKEIILQHKGSIRIEDKSVGNGVQVILEFKSAN